MHTSSTPVHALILLVAIALSSCAGPPITEIQSALAQAKPCCASYETVRFVPLVEAVRHKFQIDASTQVLRSSEGPAYFLAFQLPRGAKSLEVQALLSTGFLPNSTYADPLLVVLDSRYREIAEARDLPLVWGWHVILPGLFEHHFGATLDLPAESQYVVVFARPHSTRRQTAVADNGTRRPVPNSPVGTIALVPR